MAISVTPAPLASTLPWAEASVALDAVREAADDLLGTCDEVIPRCVAYVEAGMPELRDEELDLGLFESANDNIRLIFQMLRDGVPVTAAKAPPGALQYARIMVHRKLPLPTLLRAYRFGISFLWQLWSTELTKRITDQALLVRCLDESMSFIFEYVDRVCDEVTMEYAAERERWARSAAAVRAEVVGALLASEPLDIDACSRRLSYDLRRTHLAVVLAGDLSGDADDPLPRLEGAATHIAEALGSPRPLLVAQGRAALWMWLGFDAAPSADAIASIRDRHPALRGVDVACGDLAADVDGFRRSHDEALHVLEVMSMGPRRGRIATYERVVVPSLLIADVDRARRFVARELGRLAAEDDQLSRIRATLRVFLEDGSRCTHTARRLGIHQNTVTYRLRKAEELLGHPVSERRLEIESALRLLPLVSGEGSPASD